MNYLVTNGVYKVTRMYDYQGLCPEEQETNNPASTLLTVCHNLSGLFYSTVCTSLKFLLVVFKAFDLC